jgi:hypothetical protein
MTGQPCGAAGHAWQVHDVVAMLPGSWTVVRRCRRCGATSARVATAAA